jgi:hypothetical protein
MSDGGRDRASLGVEVWKSSQKWSVRRSAVRSIAWLDELLVVPLTNDLLLAKIVIYCKRFAATRLEVTIRSRCCPLFRYVNDFVSDAGVRCAAFLDAEETALPSGVINNVPADHLLRSFLCGRCES